MPYHVWLSNKPFTHTISQQNRISLINFLAHLCICTMGSHASLSVCLDWTKIQTRQKVITVDCNNSAYTACKLPVHCRCTPVQAGLWQRQVGQLQHWRHFSSLGLIIIRDNEIKFIEDLCSPRVDRYSICFFVTFIFYGDPSINDLW